MSDEFLHEAQRLAGYIGGLLSGKGSAVQAVVLADLTATWLHGHRAGSPEDTISLRAELLSLHCAAVRKLVRLADEEEAP
jgi:hypothetical protein